jgi:predicted ATPase
LPRFLFLSGELSACLGDANEVGAGLALVQEALARCHARQEQWYAPELLRIKGELTLKDKQASPRSTSEQCFSQAIDLAKQQGAPFWELRSAMSLARLRIGQDRKAEARQILTTAFGLLEGAEIADMRQAAAMLDALSG